MKIFDRLRKRFKKDEKGQGMVEYGLILALVSVVALVSLGDIGGTISTSYNKVSDMVTGSGSDLVHGSGTGEAIYTDEEVDALIASNYIPIASADELLTIGSNKAQTTGKGTKWEGAYTPALNSKYVQVADINLGDIEDFEPLGTMTGIYDGGGFVINDMTITTNHSYTALFSYVRGTVKNVGMVNVDISGQTSSYTGAIAGELYGNIENSYATGKIVSAGAHVGGLAGYLNSGSYKITNSYADVDVKGVGSVGGITGAVSGSDPRITNSYAIGKVTGTGGSVGGLVGSGSAPTIVNSGYAVDVGSVDNKIGTGMSRAQIEDIIKTIFNSGK